MRREDLVDLITRIPVGDHPKLQLMLRNGMAVTVDTFVRFEEHYLTVRGREAGQTEENRGFFVPYDDVICLKFEKTVKLSELFGIYGEEPPAVAQPQSAAAEDTPAPAAAATPPPPSAPVDPAEIAKQNLLKRLRDARTAVTAPRPLRK